MDYRTEIEGFIPSCEQERGDKRVILDCISRFPGSILTRESEAFHLTASGLVVDEGRTQTLLVRHNIYRSWGWTGGHADGEEDLLSVALREAKEETGIERVWALDGKIASLDILPVFGHQRRGRYVPAHLHLSAAYLLVAPQDQPLRIKEDENSGVRWFPLGRLTDICEEPQMVPVYKKLIARLR